MVAMDAGLHTLDIMFYLLHSNENIVLFCIILYVVLLWEEFIYNADYLEKCKSMKVILWCRYL